jgi:hypothetical protein
MKDDHDTDDTTDRNERAPERPTGDLEVSVEDVLPRLRTTGRRLPTEDSTTGR